MHGFDISEFLGKVVSMTVLSTHMAHFFINFHQIRGEVGEKSAQFCISIWARFFDRPQGGLPPEFHLAPPLGRSRGVQFEDQF